MADASALVPSSGGGIGGDGSGFGLGKESMDLAGSGRSWIGLLLVGAQKLENACDLAFCSGGVRHLCGGTSLCSASGFAESAGGAGGRDGTGGGLDCGVADGTNLAKRRKCDGNRTGGDLSFRGRGLGENEREGFIAGGSVSRKNAQGGRGHSGGWISGFAGKTEESGGV